MQSIYKVRNILFFSQRTSQDAWLESKGGWSHPWAPERGQKLLKWRIWALLIFHSCYQQWLECRYWINTGFKANTENPCAPPPCPHRCGHSRAWWIHPSPSSGSSLSPCLQHRQSFLQSSHEVADVPSQWDTLGHHSAGPEGHLQTYRQHLKISKGTLHSAGAVLSVLKVPISQEKEGRVSRP